MKKSRLLAVLFLISVCSFQLYAQQIADLPDLNLFRVEASKTAIRSGESITLHVQYYDDITTPLVGTATNENKWTNLSKRLYTSIKWEATGGGGKIVADPADPAKATFTAAAGAPVGTVFVTATIIGLTESSSAKRNTAASKLTIPVVIIKDQYVTFTVDGKTYTVNGDCESGCIRHKQSDRFRLKVTLSNNRELSIMASEYAEGTYSFGNEEKSRQVSRIRYISGYENDSKTYQSSYQTNDGDCSLCKEVHAEGSVTITEIQERGGEEVKLTKEEAASVRNGTASKAVYQKMAQQIGNTKTTYVDGTFTGILYYNNKKESKTITGHFRVKAW